MCLPVDAESEVELTLGASRAGDTAKACAVKYIAAVGEVGMVKRIKRRHPEFDIAALAEAGSLHQT